MSERLADKPELLDCATLARTYGVTRAAADKIMRKLPKVRIDGLRKTYVRRRDVERLLDESTRAA